MSCVDKSQSRQLDNYDVADLDNTAYAPTSLAARRKAEEDLLQRDKKERKAKQRGSSQRGALPTALLSSSSDEENEAEFFQVRKARRTDYDLEALEDEQIMGEDDEGLAINLGADQKCPLRQ